VSSNAGAPDESSLASVGASAVTLPLAPSDAESWIRLARIDISARRLRRLLDHYGDPEATLNASDRDLRSLGFNDSVIERFHAAATAPLQSELSRMKSLGIRAIPWDHPCYPPALAEIYDPPVALFLRGELLPADSFAIGIVGSRRASSYGKDVAERLARELSEIGFTVVSGLARGVDTAAHQGVLASGGRTIGVLGCGVDIAYPASNRGLIERVIQSGAVMSEFAPGTTPDAWRFPARNRIISGLSKGIVVCESGTSSGALITVNYALEQGREVFAVPGSVETGANGGCHQLLREGAGLVESAKDVLEALGMSSVKPKSPEPSAALSPDEQRLLDLVGFDRKSADDLIDESGLKPSEANAALMMLELYGKVKKIEGGFYVRTSLI
jgi:DNA processing protein